MKYLILIAALCGLLKSAKADFFVQYDNNGKILGTVTGKKAPVVSGRNQISFTEPVETTGLMLDTLKVTNGTKYPSVSAAQKFKVDPVYAAAVAASDAAESAVVAIPDALDP